MKTDISMPPLSAWLRAALHSLPGLFFFFFFPAVVHSLMDEMKYPALPGRIPAQAKLALTAANAPLAGLNEARGEIERLFHALRPLFDKFSVCLMRGIPPFHIT